MNTEIRIEEIKGHISEHYVWQMLYDVSSLLIENSEGVSVNPANILWDERHFSLAKGKDQITGNDDYQYEAHEVSQGGLSEKSLVWALAATAFCMHIGCPVFNGRGGKAQEPDSPVPYIRKEMRDLSEFLALCLNYDVKKRPTLEEVNKKAKAQLDKMQSLERPRKKKISEKEAMKNVTVDNFWIEEMKEL